MNILITGASKGIGKAIAIVFAKNNFNIAICSRDKNQIDLFADELNKDYPSIIVIAKSCDISQKEQVDEYSKIVKSKFKTIDVLVNNAGVFHEGKIYNEEEGNLEKTMATNLFGAYHITRAFMDVMIKQKSGHIFNISSIAGMEPYENGSSYSISKYALNGFSKNLREEMKPFNIRVTNVLPGAVWTDSWKDTSLPKERFIMPEDVANAILHTYQLSPQTVVEEIILRPVKGDL